jgi:AcrR family transcriptional regulator
MYRMELFGASIAGTTGKEGCDTPGRVGSGVTPQETSRATSSCRPKGTRTTGRVNGEMRRRLLDAATGLFYAGGLRAVSVDRVVQGAGTTKVTFYRHFTSKDELVVAYLERLAHQEQAGLRDAVERAGAEPGRALELIAELLGSVVRSPGFRGCAFINAAAEYPDPTSAVREAVSAHRGWCTSMFEDLVRPLGLNDARQAAADLMLLRDGVMVAGYLDDRSSAFASFLRSSRAVTALGPEAPPAVRLEEVRPAG